MEKLRQYLELKIKGCDELGNMEKEKWAFRQCLKALNDIPPIENPEVEQSQVGVLDLEAIEANIDNALENNPPTPKPEQSQVGEGRIDLASINQAIEDFKQSEKWNEVDLDEEEGFPIGFECGVIWAQTHPTPKKVPTTWGELSEKEKRPYLECAEQITSDLLFCTRSWTAWSLDTMTEADFISAGEDEEIVNQAAEAIHSLLPDQNILQREGVKLLEWALSICNEIQSKKTYGNRFPETASLGSAIEEYLSDQSKPTKD